jgi:hypothetical protein
MDSASLTDLDVLRPDQHGNLTIKETITVTGPLWWWMDIHKRQLWGDFVKIDEELMEVVDARTHEPRPTD